MTPSGHWSETIEDGHVFTDAATAQDGILKAQAQEALVCDPFILKLSTKGDEGRPKTLRMQLRADGGQAALERLNFSAEIRHWEKA
jgi:hypothetical protein